MCVCVCVCVCVDPCLLLSTPVNLDSEIYALTSSQLAEISFISPKTAGHCMWCVCVCVRVCVWCVHVCAYVCQGMLDDEGGLESNQPFH